MMRSALAFTALLAALPTHAQNRSALVDLINDYRAARVTCQGEPAGRAAPLAAHPALANIRIVTGTLIDEALKRSGFPVSRAEAIFISGATDAHSVMDAIEPMYCATLLNPQFSTIGVQRTGDSWQIVLAQPAPPSRIAQLPTSMEAEKWILKAINRARAAGRRCGERYYPAAQALAWNGALGTAAQAHSADMAGQRYFSHQGKDGRTVGDRTQQAGYRWRRVGENIAVGQETPEEAVAGWLDSPGHCANIMSPDFTEMGAAYAVTRSRDTPRVYWTQVFGTPR